METSAGIVITFQNKILLCHPTNSPMLNTWSIPKGHVENGEELLEAAYRETIEEIGVKLNFNDIDPDPLEILYKKNNTSKPHKTLYCFHCEIRNLSSIGLTSEIIPYNMLQKEEVDCAAFFELSQVNPYMFWRLEPIKKFLPSL